MPSGWNLEALKAQSIAARSYALANVGKHQSEGYDLKASTEDQVYLGIQTESDNSNRAVAETRGQVLKHNGKVVTAFFHSAGGGCTEKAEHVWGGKVPYLKSVPDFDDQSPHFNWNRSVAVSNIEEALKKQGRDIGGLLGIFPLERSPSQRVTLAMVTGTLQTLLLSGEELRKILALPSTAFNIGLDMDSYLVAGRGFGHGLGMSQWGAKYLSEQGYNASQILSYYYKDVTLDQF
jgi:stage II sporulation protein D